MQTAPERQEGPQAQRRLGPMDWLQKVLAQALQVGNFFALQFPNFAEIVRKKLHERRGEPTREELEQAFCSLVDMKAATVAKIRQNEQEVLDLKLQLETWVMMTSETRLEVTTMEKRLKLLVGKLHALSCVEAMHVALGGHRAPTNPSPGSERRLAPEEEFSPSFAEAKLVAS